jgi:hypothetical protein
VDEHSCPEFDRWQQLQASGIAIDFRRIRRAGSSLSSLSDCLFDLSAFNKGSLLSENGRVSTHLYHRCDNNFPIVAKSISLWAGSDNYHLERNIETLMNLRHPCIAGPIGFVVSLPLQAVKIVRSYMSSSSLSKVISVSPEWWTPTAKAKAVAGLMLGLRFAHSFGVLHGHLTGNRE